MRIDKVSIFREPETFKGRRLAKGDEDQNITKNCNDGQKNVVGRRKAIG